MGKGSWRMSNGGKTMDKTFDDLSCYVDDIADEVMFQYCKAAEG